jgi:hypothetical protein
MDGLRIVNELERNIVNGPWEKNAKNEQGGGSWGGGNEKVVGRFALMYQILLCDE